MAQVGSLGKFIFEAGPETVRTWRRWRESLEARYGEHDVLDGTQKDQFLGVNLRPKRLGLKLVRGLTEPEDDINALNEMVRAGEAYPFIIGNVVHGNYTVRRVEVERQLTDNKGRLVIARVDIELKESLNG